MATLKIIDITGWLTVAPEPGGAEEKEWVTPHDREGVERWLFKPTKIGTLKGKKGTADTDFLRGNVWAESICYRIGVLLGIPVAQTEIVLRGALHGTISRDVSPEGGWNLHGGSVRLSEIEPDYAPRTSTDKRPNRVGHNLDRIQQVLADVRGPHRSPYEDWPAFDVFASYFLLDALVGNQDRHEDNWAVITSPANKSYLSPAFDHGSALSAGMPDRDRARILQNGTVTQWCENGRAMKVERVAGKAPTLAALACRALDRCSPMARSHWVDRLDNLPLVEVGEIIMKTPHMSDVARRLTNEILKINRERLLQCLARS